MDAKAFYDSGWQHPGLGFVAMALFALAFARRVGGLAGLSMLLLVEIASDALFTGTLSPTAPTALGTPVAIAYVILGDLRFFLLVELALREARFPSFEGLGSARAWGLATAWAFVVPVASTIPQKVWPQHFTNLNAVFLVYEAMFAVLVLALRFAVLPKRLGAASEAVRRYVLGLCAFELVQYVLWALADVVILSGTPGGWWLRTIPNALYYAAFLPFAFFSAPRASEPRAA
jgi:hypothetical protein